MPSSTEPSPRPWAWHEYEGRPGTAYIQAGEGRHLCDNQPDAVLIVEAVNNYDRLKKIEAAARACVFLLTGEPDRALTDLYEALEGES